MNGYNQDNRFQYQFEPVNLSGNNQMYANQNMNPYSNPYTNPPYVTTQNMNMNMYGNPNGLAYPTTTMLPQNHYEQAIVMRQQFMQQRREYQMKLLNEKYPVPYAMIHAGILILIGLASIGIQIFLIINRAGLYFIGSGIWVGVYLIVSGSFVLLLINKRIYPIYIAMSMLQTFGIGLSFGGLFAVYWYSVKLTDNCTSSQCPNTNSLNKSMFIVMEGLGVAAGGACIAFLAVINCIINPRFNRSTQISSVGYNPNAIAVPIQTNNYFRP